MKCIHPHKIVSISFHFSYHAAVEPYSGDESRTSWADLGLSVIIVACKSDLVKADDAVSLKRAKAIQGQLRAIALHIGAAVVFVSAATDANNSRLKRYIINRLYPESVSDERGIEVSKNLRHLL